jgi:hypothetical protein
MRDAISPFRANHINDGMFIQDLSVKTI